MNERDGLEVAKVHIWNCFGFHNNVLDRPLVLGDEPLVSTSLFLYHKEKIVKGLFFEYSVCLVVQIK